MTLLDSFRTRGPRWVDQQLRDDLRWAFRQACIGSGVAQAVDAPIAGTSHRAPEVTHVDLGPPARLTVRMLPGQLPEHLAAAGRRIAPHLGGIALRVTDRGHGWALVDVLTVDPLAGVVPHASPVGSALHPLTLGHGEDHRPVLLDLAAMTHVIVQGGSGAGKSTGAYGWLGQLAHAHDVRVTGCDPTGLLLAPWAGRWADTPAPALGTRHPAAHVATLAGLVDEMDRRVATISPGRDAVDLGPAGCPLLLAVIEEYPGLLRLLDATDPKIGKHARALMARLFGEGRKAGVRVALLAQRAEANIIGAYERGQASHRISFRVDTPEALKMLHPDVPADAVAEHATAPPGVALLSSPGRPLLRLRAPHTPYAEYVDAVAGGSR